MPSLPLGRLLSFFVTVLLSVCLLQTQVSSQGLRVRNGQLEVWSGKEFQRKYLPRLTKRPIVLLFFQEPLTIHLSFRSSQPATVMADRVAVSLTKNSGKELVMEVIVFNVQTTLMAQTVIVVKNTSIRQWTVDVWPATVIRLVSSSIEYNQSFLIQMIQGR